jgi:hypothetical protein
VSEKRWHPGEVILMEMYLARSKAPQLINVLPQVVVKDEEQALVIASLPGMTWMTRDVPGRNSMPVAERIELYMKEELNNAWYERSAQRAVLTIHPPDVSHSIRLFWDSAWRLLSWYVNLEDPYVRTERGIQVNDHTLDVIITPDLAWSWKDEAEFEALTLAGKIPTEKALAIRAEGDRVIRSLERRQWPFNEPWPDWRPEPSWVAPQISKYWTSP